MSLELAVGGEIGSNRVKPRLLFCSYHCYWDQASGAALCTRELLELLAQRGWSCRVLCGPHLDFEERCLHFGHLLAAQGVPFEQRQVVARAVPRSVFHWQHGGVPVQIYDTPLARPSQAATREEGIYFLALVERLLDRFRPDLLLTYGGDWVAEEIMTLAKRCGIPVVFALHNFAYENAAFFRPVDAVLVPSRFAQRTTDARSDCPRRLSPAPGTGHACAARKSTVGTSPSSIPSPIKGCSFSLASPQNWSGRARYPASGG